MSIPPITEDRVRAALDTVMDPELGRSLVAAGMIHHIRVDGGHVHFTLELTTPACPLRNALRAAAEEAVRALPGVESVTIEMAARVRRTHATDALLPGVRNIIAVASGKGGVGKSTVAANLAVALAQHGVQVGLLDLDIYGPSIPLLFNVTEQPEYDADRQKLHPVTRHSVQLMSLGMLLDDNKPVIWRGPMVAGAVQQLLRDVDWGELDYLVVDLPPGTGDAPLSLAQLVPLTGVVIVTTAQDAALTIATKSLHMFQTMQVPILGIIENMSTFVCPNCRQETQVFGHPGAAEHAAHQLDVPFLGRIPLDADVVVAGDQGTPTVVSTPSSPSAEAFKSIAQQIAAQASIQAVRQEKECQ